MKQYVKRLLSLALVVIMVLSMSTGTLSAAGRGSSSGRGGSGWGWFWGWGWNQPAEEESSTPEEENSVEESAPEEIVEEESATETSEETTDASEEESSVEESVAEETESSEEAAPAEEETPAEESSEAPAESEESSEEEAPAEEENTEVAYPAISFESEEIEGVTVKVEAPEGALPEGTTMEVAKVELEAVQEAVDKAEDVNGTVVAAVDITFRNADGEEIEPLSEITVIMTSDEIAKVENPVVVHVDTNADEIAESDAVAEEVEATAEDDAVTFEADQFSVYAVVDEGSSLPEARATVNFISNGSTIATMYVKNKDTADELKTILYDPGVGTLATGEKFLGWTLDEGYTADSDRKTITQVREYMESLPITEGDVVNFYAVISKTVTLTYLDENNVAVESTSAELIGVESIEMTVNANAPISSSEQNFEGWEVFDGNENIVSAKEGDEDISTPYPNGTVLTIKGDVKLSVYAPEGHWLIFDENGKGGTYNAPQFLKSDEVTARPRPDSEMTRNGYTFDGWYKDADCTEVFTFGNKISENTTIYAKWNPSATANYTIIIWKQRSSDDKNAVDSAKTYDFAESITLSGNVGSTINTVTANGTGNNRYARVNNVAKQWEGFHLNRYDESVTITTEGTAVLNVYYDRNLVTLTFQHRGNNRWVTDQTMTGLYGSTLASNGYTWPTTNYWWYDSYKTSWTGGYSSSGTRTTFLDAFILANGGSNQTYYGFSGSGTNTIRFYKQSATNDSQYELANTVNSANGTFHISDKYNGFKAVSYSTNNSTWTSVGNKGSDGYYTSVSNYSNLYIRYDRLKYNLLYMDGIYVDGNNVQLSGYSSRGQLNVVADITYGADMDSYNSGKTNYYEPTYDGFVFEGWFTDDQCTQPYTFTTMPEGLTVYAKWRQIQYRVFLHPQAGTDSTLDWGSDNQAMNFRISIGSKVSVPTGLRHDYKFLGWYLDEGYSRVFNADAYVLNETTVTGKYDKTVDMTDPMDKWGNIGANPSNSDINRSWITKKLDIYGRWSAILIGADGIGIIYDANGGTNAPSDTTLYIDSANAVAQAASTAPAGKVFKHWVVQKWNGTAYEDTSITVEPGDTFAVLKENAKQEALEGSTEADPKYSYTVQLRAEYEDKEEPTPTHITWYSNLQDVAGLALTKDSFTHDGITESDANGWKVTDDKNKDGKALQINEAIDIRRFDTYTYPGYTFLGWAKSADATADDLFLKWVPATDDVAAHYEAQVNGTWTTVTQVAADEKQPYEDLYAIWQGVFYVYHSGIDDGNVETITITTTTYDLTQNLTSGTLYGGYYLEDGFTKPDKVEDKVPAYDGDNWTWTTAETVNGKAITPVGGTTYYIKEVPASRFLQPYTHYTYYKASPNNIGNMWMISDIDDLNYTETGFIVTKNDIATICVSLTVQNQVGGTSVKLTPQKVFKAKGATANDYLTYCDETDLKSGDSTVKMYWVTPDNLQVTGTVQRDLSGDGTKAGLSKTDTTIASTITAR